MVNFQLKPENNVSELSLNDVVVKATQIGANLLENDVIKLNTNIIIKQETYNGNPFFKVICQTELGETREFTLAIFGRKYQKFILANPNEDETNYSTKLKVEALKESKGTFVEFIIKNSVLTQEEKESILNNLKQINPEATLSNVPNVNLFKGFKLACEQNLSFRVIVKDTFENYQKNKDEQSMEKVNQTVYTLDIV